MFHVLFELTERGQSHEFVHSRESQKRTKKYLQRKFFSLAYVACSFQMMNGRDKGDTGMPVSGGSCFPATRTSAARRRDASRPENRGPRCFHKGPAVPLKLVCDALVQVGRSTPRSVCLPQEAFIQVPGWRGVSSFLAVRKSQHQTRAPLSRCISGP